MNVNSQCHKLTENNCCVENIFLPAELIRLSVPVISAQSVWLSSLQRAPSFHSPPSFSQLQPESRASARSLNVAFAVRAKTGWTQTGLRRELEEEKHGWSTTGSGDCLAHSINSISSEVCV